MIKRTKIICTIGPATESFISLKRLHKAGMNVARLNMSHSNHSNAKKIIDRIRKLNKQVKNPVGILLDTQGPEIRTGDTSEVVNLEPGQLVSFTVRDEIDVETTSIRVHYDELIQSVSVGTLISLDNGLLNFKVLKKTKNQLECKVLDGGKLGSKRHVNLPGIRINLPSITEKDKRDIAFGLKENVDFIALSFVRDASDIEDLKKILKTKIKKIKIISKIEDREGLSNIDDICKVSDAVMVARGDLGIETDLANLPNVQRKIMSSCAKYGVNSIVATHLLESMIENPTPTRAEVTDVANAIYEGADAVMLSGETTIGKYPIEAVNFISRIATQTEKYRTLGYEEKLISETDWKYLNDFSTRGGFGDIEGVLVPAGTSTVYDQNLGKNIKRPFLHVRYRASETENRKMKSWVTGSVGGASSSPIDEMRMHYLSERCLIVQGANNFVLFKA